jgi:hypothetical protein
MGKVWKLIKAFKSKNGRLPNGGELEEIRRRADRIELDEKVIDFPSSKITDWTKPRPMDQGSRVSKNLEGLMQQGLIKKGRNVKKTKAKEPVDQKLVDDVKNREMFEATNKRLTSDQKLIKEKYEASNKIAAKNLRRKKKKKKEGIESIDTGNDLFSDKVSLPIRLMKNFDKELDYAELAAEGYNRQQIEVLIKAREILKRGDELNPNEALLRVKEEMADARGIDVEDFTEIDFEVETGPLDFASGGRVRYAEGTEEDEDGNQLGFTSGLGKLINNPLTRTIAMSILSGGTLTAPAIAKEMAKNKALETVGTHVVKPIIKKGLDRVRGDRGDGTHGRGSDGQKSYDTGMGFGAHATSGGPVSNKTGRGRQDWAEGGRIGFAAGGIDKMRRAFLKIMGAGAAGVGAAKSGLFGLLKGGGKKQIAKEIITTPSAAGKPVWFDALVTRVVNEGTDVTKKFATKEREIVHSIKIDDDATAIVYRDLDSGTVRVDIDDATRNVVDEQGNAVVSMEVRGGQLEEGVKGKTKTEFEAVESDYRNYMDGPDDYTTETIENVVGNTKDLTADLTKVKMFAKGQKKPTIKEMMTQRKRGKTLKQAEENPSEYAQDRGPDVDWDDNLDYASGGRAGYKFGKIVKGIGALSKKKPKINFQDQGIQRALKRAGQKGIALSDAMVKMGMDPSKQKDYFKFEELVSAGMGGFPKEIKEQIIRAKYGDIVDTKLLNQMLIDDNPQRLSEVMGTIEQGLIMQERGMGVDEIVTSIKESFKRQPNASGGIARMLGE